MAGSRCAHYLRVIVHETRGSNLSREECEAVLNRWITQYVSESDTPEQGDEVYHPLNHAHIEVHEDRERPGVYAAALSLEPQHLLLGESVAMRLVVPLPYYTSCTLWVQCRPLGLRRCRMYHA